MADDPTNNNPRQLKDIQGLLKFCVEATRSEDAPEGSTAFEEMSEERKKWLEEALTQMTVSPAERMSLCVEAIMTAELDTEYGTEAQVKAISELQDWVEDLDIAKDFIKLKGLRILPRLLSSEVSELRWRCLELLATLAQNNPYAQKTLLSLKLMPVLLALVDQDDNSTVRVKALYAVSCLVRSHVGAQAEFASAGGLSVLLRALSRGEEKLTLKSTFLMSALCDDNPGLKDTLTQGGAVDLLVKVLRESEHGQSHEHVMSALLRLVRDNASAHAACLNPDLDLKTFLCQRLRLLAGKDEFLEERDYADKLLQLLNTDPGRGVSSAQSSCSSMAVLPV